MKRRLVVVAAILSLPLGFGALLLNAYFRPWITPRPGGGWNLGPLSRYPKGTATLLRRAEAIVVHDDDGVRAYSSVCTHQRCTVRPSNARQEIACPCHGAAFDFHGRVKLPPATIPLPPLPLREETGELVLGARSLR